jgi:hypothetical protein
LYTVSIQANDAGIDFSDLTEAHKKLPLGSAKDIGGVNPAEVVQGFYSG